MKIKAIHSLIFVGWFATALGFGAGVAMCGSEQAQLKRQRGADHRTQNECRHRLLQVASKVDREASEPRIDEAVRDLELPLRRPLRLASVP
ncbi:MAG: hypothetical protein ACYTF0_00495 [Planctomycetota bacterium]|jgi:hypothetical protein